MCIGIPMQVVESNDFVARCEGRGETADLNMLLVGPQEPGTWVLNFLGSAREVLTEDEARQIGAAAQTLAEAEGLTAHAAAVAKRKGKKSI